MTNNTAISWEILKALLLSWATWQWHVRKYTMMCERILKNNFQFSKFF